MLFVTLVNVSYLPGLYALLESIRQNGDIDSSQKFLVIYLEEQVLQYSDRLRAFGYPVDFLSIDELGHVSAPLVEGGHKVYQVALQKLLIFRLPHEGPVCFMDCDMICLNSIRQLYQMDHFSVAISARKGGAFGRPEFNSGLMVFRPSQRLYEEIMEFIAASNQLFKHGDQGILNHFFYSRYLDEVHALAPQWNVSKKKNIENPIRFGLNQTKFLHFIAKKPWEKGGRVYFFLKWFLGKRSALGNLEFLWWKFYFGSQLRQFFKFQ